MVLYVDQQAPFFAYGQVLVAVGTACSCSAYEPAEVARRGARQWYSLGVTVQTVVRDISVDVTTIWLPGRGTPLGKEYILWVMVYVAAYFGHRQRQDSAVVRAPTLVWLMCGKPLPDRQLQLVPLILQLSMVTMLVAGVVRFAGIISRPVELIVVAFCVFGALAGTALALIASHPRKTGGSGPNE
jgi:hypothetical protein